MKTNKSYRPSLFNTTNLDKFDSKFDSTNEDKKTVYQIKLIVIGDSGVGKTSIIKRLQYDIFSNIQQSTISIDCCVATFKIDDQGTKADVLIWDTAGSEKFRAITKSYYNDVHGVLLVFDTTNMNSFIHLDSWLNDLDQKSTKNNKSNKSKKDSGVSIVLCGNKVDEVNKREVDYAMADNWAMERKIKYFESSAKLNTNITILFEELTSLILAKVEDKSLALETSKIRPSLNNSKFEDSVFCFNKSKNILSDEEENNNKSVDKESVFKDKSISKKQKKENVNKCC